MYIIFKVFSLQPPRRLEDFAAMKITTENDPQQLRNKNVTILFQIMIIIHLNLFIINPEHIKHFWSTIFDIKKDLADVLKQYIKAYKLKENTVLFRLSTDVIKRQQESNFSKLVSDIFKKIYKSSVSITNRSIRISYATYFNTLNLTIKQRKDVALKMAHNFINQFTIW